MVEDPRDVILVDNGSGGEMISWAAEHAPRVTVLTRAENGFFCGGYNTGMQHAIDGGYEFVLIVNADTEVCAKDFLQRMLEAVERFPHAAFFGPKVFLREIGDVQNTVLTFPGFWRNVRAFVQYKLLGGRPTASNDCEREIEFLNSVCVLCRVEALREIGLFDEDMGGYVEDADWSWRARQLGWSSVYTPVESILHQQPERGYEHHSQKSFMLRRNQIYWQWKRGRTTEARLYGWSARLLSWLRLTLAKCRGADDSGRYAHFHRRLSEVDRGIRSGRAMGNWFGPPAGKF